MDSIAMEARPAGKKGRPNFKRELTLLLLKANCKDPAVAAKTEKVVTAEAAATLRKIPSSPIPFITTRYIFIPRVVITFISLIETKRVALPSNLRRAKGTWLMASRRRIPAASLKR